MQVYYFSAGLVRPYRGGALDTVSDDLPYSFNINSGSGIAFSLLVNNTADGDDYLLQRTSLAELKAHSQVSIVLTPRIIL